MRIINFQPLENEIVKLWFDDGFLIGEYKVEELDLEAAKKALQLRIEITQNTSYFTCATGNKLLKFTKEARDFMSKPEAYKNIKAFAGVNTNLITRMIAKFYLTVKNRPFNQNLLLILTKQKHGLNN